MTTFSPDPPSPQDHQVSELDLAAFALSEDDLSSLRGLSGIWRGALAPHLAAAEGDLALLEFLVIAERLPLALADAGWQREWVAGWQTLTSRGYAQADIFRLFFTVVAQCENELLGDSGSVSRVIINLFTCLRRAVLAAIISVIDLSGLARGESEDALPGELIALRNVRERLLAGELFGLLSISASNREAFTSLPAADLQQIPYLLAEHIAACLRPEDQIFSGRDNEWLVLLNGLQTPAQVMLAATQISRSFEPPCCCSVAGGCPCIRRSAVWPCRNMQRMRKMRSRLPAWHAGRRAGKGRPAPGTSRIWANAGSSANNCSCRCRKR